LSAITHGTGLLAEMIWILFL